MANSVICFHDFYKHDWGIRMFRLIKRIESLCLHSSKSWHSVCMIGKYEDEWRMTHSQSSRPEFLAGSANSLLWLHSGITQEAAKAPQYPGLPRSRSQHSGNCWGYKAWASSCCAELTVYSRGDWKHVKTVGYDRWCHKLYEETAA